MAGRTFTINFDSGIEKVEYSYNYPYTTPDGEVTVSGQKLSTIDLYVRPIFKTGYELDTTNVPLAYGALDIYVCIKDGVPIENVTFTSKQASTFKFKHLADIDTIGTGTYKFRHFAQEQGGGGK